MHAAGVACFAPVLLAFCRFVGRLTHEQFVLGHSSPNTSVATAMPEQEGVVAGLSLPLAANSAA
jgi:hypothetical protein